MPSQRRPSTRRRSPCVRHAVGDLEPFDDVIDGIQRIIDWSIDSASPIGYFAVLYMRMTIAIRDAVQNNRFEDNPRMARLDQAFAGRYFDAFDAHCRGGKPPEVWRVAFEKHKKSLTIVQHLLTAMNAHIDLDLGVATEQIGKPLGSIHNDFNAVNTILASQVPGVLDKIEKVSPAFAEYRRWMANKDTGFITLALELSRENAWEFASELVGKAGASRNAMIKNRDAGFAVLGRWYVDPVPFAKIMDAIGAKESHDVVRNIKTLSEVASTPGPLPRKLF